MSDNPIPARPRLLLVAFECSPRHGSEWANGWNRALQAAHRYETCVITRGDDQEREIRDYLAQHGPIANLRFEFLSCEGFGGHPVHVGGRRWIGYGKWQRTAFARAQQLHQGAALRFVSPGNQHRLSRAGLPVAARCAVRLGAHRRIAQLSVALSRRSRFARRSHRGPAQRSQYFPVVLQQPRSKSRSPRQDRAGRELVRLPAILSGAWCAADRTAGCRHCVRLGSAAPDAPAGRTAAHPVVGTVRRRKALSLLLKALARLPGDVDYKLRVVGGGPLEARWKQLAERLGIASKVDWVGWLPHDQARQQYDWADVFVFTSLRDNSGTVMLEAMGAGLPVICLDHQGGRDIVTAASGVKIAPRNPRQVVADLAAVLVGLARDVPLREQLGAARTNARKITCGTTWADERPSPIAKYWRMRPRQPSAAQPTSQPLRRSQCAKLACAKRRCGRFAVRLPASRRSAVAGRAMTSAYSPIIASPTECQDFRPPLGISPPHACESN